MATEDHASIRKKCVESIIESTDYVLKYLNGDEKDRNIAELKSYIQCYCILDKASTFPDGRICEGDSPEDIIDKLGALPLNSELSNHEYMKAFLVKIGNQNFIKDDADLEIISMSQSLQDPITKQKIKTPMMNKACGHVYDKKSIFNLMKYKKNVLCPYVGCISIKPLSKKMLVPHDMPVERSSTPPCNDSTVEVFDDDDEGIPVISDNDDGDVQELSSDNDDGDVQEIISDDE